MSADQIVNEFIAAIERKDTAAAAALCSEDVSYENVPIRPITGRDGVASTLDSFLANAGEVDWQITNQWVVGQTVINERLDRFQIGDGWLELPVAGIFNVNDEGLITLWRDYFDMATYARQLEALSGADQ